MGWIKSFEELGSLRNGTIKLKLMDRESESMVEGEVVVGYKLLVEEEWVALS